MTFWGNPRTVPIQRPVIDVSWEDAQAYARWLSHATGKSYRLPTEAEWEYGARSGDKQQTWAGTSEENELTKYAVYSNNSGGKTAEVGSREPNGLELYDMSGNVREWVEDCWHKNYTDAPKDGSAWLREGGVCGRRVIRGGSWNDRPGYLRSSFRSRFGPDFRGNFIGFRLAQSARTADGRVRSRSVYGQAG